MFLRYLDLYDAIEERSLDMLDNSDFADTDIPMEVPLPDRPHLDAGEHEAVKEWVLAVSMDNKVVQKLPTDDRGVFEASLASPGGAAATPCLVSGYPVLGPRIDFARPGMAAIREEWNRLVMVGKMASTAADSGNVQDVLKFASAWGGGAGGGDRGGSAGVAVVGGGAGGTGGAMGFSFN